MGWGIFFTNDLKGAECGGYKSANLRITIHNYKKMITPLLKLSVLIDATNLRYVPPYI